MTVDSAWVERNLGFDPIKNTPPINTFAYKPASDVSARHEDLAREIIDFDSEAPEGLQFFAYSKATGLSRFTEIPWPQGLAPKAIDPAGAVGEPLPQADVLVVTWTVDEGHALSRVLTPGKDSQNDYLAYTHNYEAIAASMRPGCPARNAQRLGTYWMSEIAGASVLVFKSDSHMSQDGPKLPNREVWLQIIQEVQPKLVITTGTAGGVGNTCEVGDVVVSPLVRFECLSKFKDEPFAKDHFASLPADTSRFEEAEKLMEVNAPQLPSENTRPPKIFVTTPDDLPGSVMTTDFFGFDTSDNHWHLQGLASVCEMGDAVLGLVAKELGEKAPSWLAIRNVSDPQIKAEGTLQDQARIAAQIYKGYGRWSSVCSALACWASIVSFAKKAP